MESCETHIISSGNMQNSSRKRKIKTSDASYLEPKMLFSFHLVLDLLPSNLIAKEYLMLLLNEII